MANGDPTTANALTTSTVINTAKAVEPMRETPFAILDAVEFFLEHAMPQDVITVDEAIDIIWLPFEGLPTRNHVPVGLQSPLKMSSEKSRYKRHQALIIKELVYRKLMGCFK